MKLHLAFWGCVLLPAALLLQGCPSNNKSPEAPAPVTIVELVTASSTPTPAVSPSNTPNGTATPTPPPPVVSNGNYTINENTPLVLSNANLNSLVVSDPGGGPLVFILVGPPDHGTAAFSHAAYDNTLTYTPNSGFYGTDSFSYRVNDEAIGELSAVQDIVITVAFVPTATPTPTLTLSPTVTLSATPTGSATPTPSFTFSPTPTFTVSGTVTPPSFTPTMTSTPTITPIPTPVLSNASFGVTENSQLLVGEPAAFSLVTSDPNDDPLYFSLVSSPNAGTVTLSANGSFEYAPDNGFTGTDQFTVEVTDSDTNLSSAPATFTMTVSP